MKVKVTYWREADGKYLGYLNDYPDHWTQGEDLDDLKEQLRDLFELFGQEEIPGISESVPQTKRNTKRIYDSRFLIFDF
jgi:predicted RNase H-like HicB family nuclease